MLNRMSTKHIPKVQNNTTQFYDNNDCVDSDVVMS